jgi:hypothetical protein
MILIESTQPEIVNDVESGKKVKKIVGPFLQFDKENGNRRVYPEKVMDKAVSRYKKEYIDQRRALGEMNHPSGQLSVNPERACILTEKLEKDGKYYIGTAKVLSTPLGKLLECLLDDGVKIGVSSRGSGDTTNRGGVTYVADNFVLSVAADVVFNPSAQDAFVECIMEDKEYVRYGEILVEKSLYDFRETIRRAPSTKLEQAKLQVFQKFLNSL